LYSSISSTETDPACYLLRISKIFATLGLFLSTRIAFIAANLSLATMPSDANAFEINEIQEHETEARITW